MSTTELATLLEDISSLPAETNPYLYLVQALYTLAVPKAQPWFKWLMFVNYGICASGLLASLLVVLLKACNSGTWLYRKRQTASGALLTINTSFLLSVFSGIFFALAILTIKFLLDAFIERKNPRPYQLMQSAVWLPIPSLSWIQVAGMGSATLLSQHANQQTSKRRVSFARKAITLPKWPTWILNALFIIFFPLYWTSAVVVFCIAGHKLSSAWHHRDALNEAIETLSASWAPGQSFQFQANWLSHMSSYASDLEDTVAWIGYAHCLLAPHTFWKTVSSHGFLVHALAILCVTVVFLPVSYAYTRMLSRQISAFARSAAGNGSNQSTPVDQDIHSLKRSYRMMAAETGIVFAFSLFYLALAFWVAIDTKSVMESSSDVCLAFGLVFSSFSSLALILALLILYRTSRTFWASRTASGRGSSEGHVRGVQVKTEVMTYIEQEDRVPVAYAIATLLQPPSTHSPAVVHFENRQDEKDLELEDMDNGV